MGLLLGASVLTVFELLDLVVFNVMKKLRSGGKKNNANGDSKLPLQNDSDVIQLPGSSSHSPSTAVASPGTAPSSSALSRKPKGTTGDVIENPMNGVTDYGFGNNNYGTQYWPAVKE